MKRLKGKVALVTGASSGIGEGVAKAFAREGADVAINYPSKAQERNIWHVRDAIEKAGRRALVVKADVSKEDQVKRMVNAVLREFGCIDILVNNAGIANTAAPLDKMPVSMWDEMIAVNLRSVFLCTRYVLPHMYKRDYGKIINNSTQFAYTGSENFAHYTAAKAAVISLTRTAAIEVGPRNINVNCVAPGGDDDPHGRRRAEGQARRRAGTPDPGAFRRCGPGHCAGVRVSRLRRVALLRRSDDQSERRRRIRLNDQGRP